MFKSGETETMLEREITRALRELNAAAIGSEEYATVLERLQKLYKLRAEDKSERLSPDTILTTMAHLLGMILIIRHEHVNVIATKAMSFVPRP